MTLPAIKVVGEATLENYKESKIAISSNGYFAICNEKKILLQQFGGDQMDIITLRGHHSEISSLTINACHGKTYLASGGSYYIILWEVHQVIRAAKAGEEIRGKILTKLENCPAKALSFSPQNTLLCTLHSTGVTVYCTKSKSVVWTRANGMKCTESLFLSESTVILVTACPKVEVWNCEDDSLLWASPLLKNPVQSVSIGDEHSFILGFSNNMVTNFVNSRKPGAPCDFTKKFDIDLDMEMFRSKSCGKSEDAESQSQVISTFVAKCTVCQDSSDIMNNILCATSSAIFVINSTTQEVEILPWSNFGINFISAASFSQNPSGDIFCIVTSLFSNQIQILRLDIPQPVTKPTDQIFSVLPKAPLADNSQLKKSLVPSKKPVKPTNKPVTFHTKIKSSGYGARPTQRKMFQPMTSAAEKPKQKPQMHPKVVSMPKNSEQCLEWHSTTPTSMAFSTSEKPTNVNHISISECNSYLSCALQSNSVLILQRKTKKQVAVLSGHDGAIFNSFWTNDSTFLITSSGDCTGRVWSFLQPEKAVFAIDYLRGNLGKSAGKIPQEVTYSQFYYMDKFYILTFGNSFGLYVYHIDMGPKSDIKRYVEKKKYKLINLTPLPDVQTITSFAAPNNVYSYIALACGSDRSLHVFDMNIGSEISQMRDIHTRPACCIKQNTGSAFVQPSTYDLFATCAPSDGVKLWDTRSIGCIGKFNSHPSSGICPLDIAPCGRYIATSADDRSLYIYDIRKASKVCRSSQEKERISSLCFSKDGREVCLGLRNGNIAAVCATE